MTSADTLRATLAQHFQSFFDLAPVRPDVFEVLLPHQYPDGDAYEVFVRVLPGGGYVVQDFGRTLQKLEYAVNPETNHKQELIQRILAENQVSNEEGNFYIQVGSAPELVPALLALVDAIGKISALRLLAPPHYANVFYEELRQLLYTAFPEKLVERYEPPEVPSLDDYTAPYALLRGEGQLPLCIFAIGSNDQCDQATITAQHYRLNGYQAPLLTVYDTMSRFNQKKVERLTNIMDKQFPFLTHNHEPITRYLSRQLQLAA